jgi:hypothetical protein
MLTVADVQARLTLKKPDAVLSAIHAGHLAAVNVSSGRRPTWRIDPAALESFLLSRRAMPAVKTERRPGKRLVGIMEFF